MAGDSDRFKKMIEASQDWFWEFDENAIFTYASPTVKDLLGYEPEELVGRNAFDLMDEEEAKRVHRHFDPLAKKYLPFTHLENINIHKDGHEVVIESSGTPIFDDAGHFRGYRGIDRDITQRKRTEEALRLAKQSAEEANRVKGAFLANMSHELRTPLIGIKGFTELLNKTDLSGEQKEFVETIYLSSNNLLKLIDNILDITKIESNGFEIIPEEFSLRNCVVQLVTLVTPQARHKQIVLETTIPDEIPDIVCGDQSRISQVLLNLLDNAIKFTDQGSVSVSVSWQKKKTPSADFNFHIRDTGCGISPEQQQHVFEQFVQAEDSTTRRYGGSGLGLTISRHLAELMGGSISLQSQVDVGTTVSLHLPMTLSE